MNSFICLPTLLICLMISSFGVAAEPGTQGQSGQAEALKPPISLANLAAAADVVALVQMRDGDYRYQRKFPISGSAHLKVLISYKADQPLDMIEVYEIGLHPHECYFPNPDMLEEGRRYLVFLRRDPDDHNRYRGLPEGCALDVLVTADNAYALRIPATGIDLSDDLLKFARDLQFADPYASVAIENMETAQREAWLEAGWLRQEINDEGQLLTFTRGVNINDVRTLMGPAGFSEDRHQKRLPADP